MTQYMAHHGVKDSSRQILVLSCWRCHDPKDPLAQFILVAVVGHTEPVIDSQFAVEAYQGRSRFTDRHGHSVPDSAASLEQDEVVAVDDLVAVGVAQRLGDAVAVEPADTPELLAVVVRHPGGDARP